jgi:hypothetical protein
MDARQLACGAFRVMQDVLIHQRHRWGPLLTRSRQYEGWWKAELITALDKWHWASDLKRQFGVLSEVKPRDVGLGAGSGSVDVVIAPRQAGSEWASAERTPRVWIELKERGTWWEGGPGKALQESGRSLAADLAKWAHIPWSGDDVVAVCQIISHRSQDEDACLPKRWSELLDSTAVTSPRCVPSRSVGYPLAGVGGTLWATMEILLAHGAVAPDRSIDRA